MTEPDKCLICKGFVDSPDSEPTNVCTFCYWKEIKKRKKKKYVSPYTENRNTRTWEMNKVNENK